MTRIICIAIIFVLSGCATHTTNLVKPSIHEPKTQKTVKKSFDDAWKDMVSGLSRSFFVINNIEKESGIINVSYYSEDPYDYIDCGVLHSTVDGKTTSIDLSRDETYAWPYQRGVYRFSGTARRDVSLSGRVNIYVEAKGEESTEINANTKYVVSVLESFYNNNGQSLNQIKTETTFQTGTTGSMYNIVCRGTGELEEKILALVE